MRGRFLNLDYFNNQQLTSDLEFLRLPDPQIPNISPNPIDFHRFLHSDVSLTDSSRDLHSLPIEEALSSFFSDVLPHRIHVSEEDFRAPENEDRVLSGSGTSQLKVAKASIEETKNQEGFKLIHFETPNLDFSEEQTSCALREQENNIFFEVSEIEIPQDMRDVNVGDTIPFPSTVSESVYSVQKVPIGCIPEEKSSYPVEDESSVRQEACQSPIRYPLLEVNETGLECCSFPSPIQVLDILFKKIECQQLTQKDTLIVDGQELLGSTDVNILECLSEHCPVTQPLDLEATYDSLMIEVDFVCIRETKPLQGSSATHSETFEFSFPLTSPLELQEFQIFDLNSFPSFEDFVSSLSTIELETCEQMFEGCSNSIGTFYETFVSDELTLVDDIFLSMPIPVLADDIEIWALSILDDILAELKPHPPPASDAIYLDWHLLQESRCEHDICSHYWNMVEEIDACSMSMELKSVDNEIIIKFVLDDESSDGLDQFERKEVLDEPVTDVSPSGLSKKERKQIPEIKEKVAPKVFKSMSQFSELDFFLNTRKATKKRTGEHSAEETTDREAKTPAVPRSNAVITCASMEMEDTRNQNIEGLQNFVPVEEKDSYSNLLKPANILETCSVPMPASKMPSAMEVKQIRSRSPSSPDIIIIVNTQNCDKEMLVSRRSSYQKILAMEKKGAQVVEREVTLPVDLILSAALCLIWYDHSNIWKKSASADEASSSIPMCVESIATNILMSLSFAFTSCVLVFEGESKFLATIMESSDALYAAAASLGLDLQLFCSCSSELTDEIILNCVDYAIKLNRGLYPKMSESETLAESFLTRFPSINPLSAHAILSSGGLLVDFLEWSHGRRIQAIGKYHVPDDSVVLFSALCKYGEQEEPKSGTTECSLVYSAQDLPTSSSKTQSERKRQKCTSVPQAIDLTVDDYFLLEPLKRSIDDSLKASSLSHDTQPYQSRIFSKTGETLEEVQGFDFSLNEPIFNQKRSLDTSVLENLHRNAKNRSNSVYNGEVINLDDSNLLGEDICSAENSLMEKLEKGKSLACGNPGCDARISSVGMDNYPDFPSFEEINSGPWNCSKDQTGEFENIFDHAFIESDKEDTLSLRTRGELLMEKTTQRSKGSDPRQISGRNITGPYAKMPLSKVIHSSGLQQGSPWTLEFLNKVKEKSRLHQEALLNHNIDTLYGYSTKMENSAKRRSPSILDNYRYQGGTSFKKITKRNWKKQFIPPPSASRKEKASASLAQTWTPDDKRARQVLSFARNGNERQSKLVWSDGGTQNSPFGGTPNSPFGGTPKLPFGKNGNETQSKMVWRDSGSGNLSFARNGNETQSKLVWNDSRKRLRT